MTPDMLSDWRMRLGLNKSQAAEAIGLSRNGYSAYETGLRPIPRYIELACSAIDKRNEPDDASARLGFWSRLRSFGRIRGNP